MTTTITSLTTDEELTIAERTRVNFGILLQALRESIQAMRLRRPLEAKRAAEIDALLDMREAKDPELFNALALVVATLKGRRPALTSAEFDTVYLQADTDNGIESTLVNDENATDEEMADYFVAAYRMRPVEAWEHIKRRSYLMRYSLSAF